ncbi:MAG: Hpt domain-containing protein [Lachnospiraceae bacterium]|nr:Hpt domain-containing protein [Lachnospiraceae bacterium]
MSMEKLQEYGVDTEQALKRCVNNEALFLKLINKVPQMTEFEDLKESINNKNFEVAFGYAHAIKGNVSNLEITPIKEPVAEMTELLRANQDVDYTPYIEKMDEGLEGLKKALAD